MNKYPTIYTTGPKWARVCTCEECIIRGISVWRWVPSGQLFARVPLAGEDFNVPIAAHTQEDALNFVRERGNDIWKQLHQDAKKWGTSPVLVHEALAAGVEAEIARRAQPFAAKAFDRISKFWPDLGDLRIVEIYPRHIAKCHELMGGSGNSLVNLVRFLKSILEAGITLDPRLRLWPNAWSEVEVPRSKHIGPRRLRQPVVSDADVEKLLGALDHHNDRYSEPWARIIVPLAALAGFRITEIQHFRPSSVVWAHGEPASIGVGNRIVPLCDRLRDFLKRYLADWKPYWGPVLQHTSVHLYLAKLAAVANASAIPSGRGLNAWFVKRASASGQSIPAIARYLGLTEMSVAHAYPHVLGTRHELKVDQINFR